MCAQRPDVPYAILKCLSDCLFRTPQFTSASNARFKDVSRSRDYGKGCRVSCVTCYVTERRSSAPPMPDAAPRANANHRIGIIKVNLVSSGVEVTVNAPS
jgi:hypothetical protein